MWILAKFWNKNVNRMAKNNGHQNFTDRLKIPTKQFDIEWNREEYVICLKKI